MHASQATPPNTLSISGLQTSLTALGMACSAWLLLFLPAMAWYAWRYCGPSGELITEDEMIWQQWVSGMLGATLVAVSRTSQVPEKGQVSKALTHIVQFISEGNLSAFARILGLRVQQVRSWVRGEKIPQMDMLLQLCYSLVGHLAMSVHEARQHQNQPNDADGHVRAVSCASHSRQKALGAGSTL
jgi:hypothetical protein